VRDRFGLRAGRTHRAVEQLLGGTTARISDAKGAKTAELEASQYKPAPLRDELEAMGLAARDLDRLERYERRALSRRKRAIETFMAINHHAVIPEGSDFANCPGRCNTRN
jgi:hypothetical protein